MSEDDRRRDSSINLGTPGHWWGGYDAGSHQSAETDPNRLNLDNVTDFLAFLTALTKGEAKSQNFLQRIPSHRLEELKQRHSNLDNLLRVLDW